MPPDTQLTPRINQVDLSIAKRITVGRLRIDPKLDIFNVLNSDDYFTARSTTYTLTARASAPTRSRERIERHLPAAGQHPAGSIDSHRRGGELVGVL